MKRSALAALVLLGSVVAAHADTNHWVNTLKQPRFDVNTAAQIDGEYCNQTVGPDFNGRPTSAAFKRCMASRGWRLSYTSRQRTQPDQTWIDPDTGLTCHDILGGFGSVCSNF
jgi:hypothetical protein